MASFRILNGSRLGAVGPLFRYRRALAPHGGYGSVGGGKDSGRDGPCPINPTEYQAHVDRAVRRLQDGQHIAERQAF
jgi:hypothetical protein